MSRRSRPQPGGQSASAQTSPSQSDNLKEFHRLLRAGFEASEIILKGGPAEDDPHTGLEITMTPKGGTANFRYLSDAATREEPDGPIKISIPDDVRLTEVHLRGRDGAERTLQSKEKDFWDFAIAMHPSLDAKGERVLRRFRDTGRQISETKHLVTHAIDAQKRAEYLRHSVATFGPKLDGGLKAMLIQYLRTRDWGASRYLPLKEKYFELQYAILRETQSLLASQEKACSTNPVAAEYVRLVDELLNAFWQQDEGFVKRSMRFVSLVRFDIHDQVLQAAEQRRHVDDLLKMLFSRGAVPGRQGIPHLLDAYRRYCETLRPFVDVLSDMACAVEGRKPLPANLGYKKRVAFMKATRFGAIVRCLDPDIRHSESHMGTVIDDDKANVLLTEIGEDGHRRTLGQYSYWQISDMTLELQNGLFLAVLTAFAIHETGMLLTALVTPEFMAALVSIDNLAD